MTCSRHSSLFPASPWHGPATWVGGFPRRRRRRRRRRRPPPRPRRRASRAAAHVCGHAQDPRMGVSGDAKGQEAGGRRGGYREKSGGPQGSGVLVLLLSRCVRRRGRPRGGVCPRHRPPRGVPLAAICAHVTQPFIDIALIRADASRAVPALWVAGSTAQGKHGREQTRRLVKGSCVARAISLLRRAAEATTHRALVSRPVPAADAANVNFQLVCLFKNDLLVP